MTSDLRQRADAALVRLGAAPGLLDARALPLFADATDLVVAHVSRSGREHVLVPAAAVAWRRMRIAADAAAIELVMVSGFRSFDRQLELIEAKLAAGEQLRKILEVMAPPGCSEHHTGRAIDIGTPGCEPLSETFEDTAAFHWLADRASDFGFALSYPRGNPEGFRYEPWHWCYAGPAASGFAA